MPCMRNALLRGYIASPVLAPRIVNARQQWLEWHHDFALNQLPAAVSEDAELAARVAAADNRAEVFLLNDQETALQVLLSATSTLGTNWTRQCNGIVRLLLKESSGLALHCTGRSVLVVLRLKALFVQIKSRLTSASRR